MLKWIRNIGGGVTGLFFAFCGLGIGYAMLTDAGRGKTLLCFDKGCVTIQGATVMALSCLVICGLIFMQMNRYWRQWRYLRRKARRKPFRTFSAADVDRLLQSFISRPR